MIAWLIWITWTLISTAWKMLLNLITQSLIHTLNFVVYSILLTGEPFVNIIYAINPLQWCHNGRDCFSNYQRLDCLLILCSGADHRKHQSFASLAFVRWIHRWPVNSPHKGPETRKMLPFDDIIMTSKCCRYIFFESLLRSQPIK